MDKSDIQETLVHLYLRLNGYFTTGFIVHAPRGNKTEIDVLSVRFPRHKEPERQVQCCEHLAVPRERVDFLVGEVKGGVDNANFNVRFREDTSSIRSVLNRFGTFDEREIQDLCIRIPPLLQPKTVKTSKGFPTLPLREGQCQLRFVLFRPECRRKALRPSPYVFEDDLIDFVWRCFRPDQLRPLCATQYNYELWGPHFAGLVSYFKKLKKRPEAIKEVYALYQKEQATLLIPTGLPEVRFDCAPSHAVVPRDRKDAR